jgi:DNA-binding MarR family transcriptional regulator
MAADESPAPIRAALLRKGLADSAQRAALARRLGVTESHVLAIQHLASAGELTPGQLSTRLQLSSGGATGLIHRMERAGHVKRMSHPRDGRTAVLCLTPEIQTDIAKTLAPLVAELDSLAQGLRESEAGVIGRFLRDVAEAAECHATRLAADADADAQNALAVPVPALWA